MVNFYICSDCDYYKKILDRIVSEIFDSSKFYRIHYVENMQSFDFLGKDSIFIVDVGMPNWKKICHRIHTCNQQACIFVLSNYKSSSELQMTLGFFPFINIYKYSHNFEELFRNHILEVLEEKKVSSSISIQTELGQAIVPVHEIKSFFCNHEKVVIHGFSKISGNYMYCIQNPKNSLDFGKNINICNGDLQIYLQGPTEFIMKHQTKTMISKKYSKEVKEECLKLRRAGVSIQMIHQIKGVSPSTLYNWEQKEKRELEIRTLKQNSENLKCQLSKFHQIEEIMNEK